MKLARIAVTTLFTAGLFFTLSAHSENPSKNPSKNPKEKCEKNGFSQNNPDSYQATYSAIIDSKKTINGEELGLLIQQLQYRLGKENEKLSYSELDNVLRVGMAKISEMDVSGLIDLLKLTKSRHKQIDHLFLPLWEDAATKKTSSLNVEQITQLLDSLAIIRSGPNSKLVKAILARISDPELLLLSSPKQFTDLLKTLTDRQMQSSEYTYAHFTNYIGVHLPIFTPEQLTYVVLNFANLRRKVSDRIFSSWINTVLGDDISLKTLTLSLRALYLMGKLGDPSAILIAKEIREFKFHSSHKRNAIRKTDFNLILIELYVRKVLNRHDFDLADVDENNPFRFHSQEFRSTLEKRVEAQLINQGLTKAANIGPHKSLDNVFFQEWESETGIPVDFYVPSKNLIIQVDGPDHFLIDSNGNRSNNYRVSDERIDELMKAYGHTILRIRYDLIKD